MNKGIIFLVICFPGMIMMIIGFIMRRMAANRRRLCTAFTTGWVIDYKFPGEQQMYPVVEFAVNNVTYTAKKRFKATISSFSSFRKEPADAWEDERGYLHVKTGRFCNLRELAEGLWPLGRPMNVYYNPENPNMNYVDRIYEGSVIHWILMIIGAISVLIALTIMIFVG